MVEVLMRLKLASPAITIGKDASLAKAQGPDVFATPVSCAMHGPFPAPVPESEIRKKRGRRKNSSNLIVYEMSSEAIGFLFAPN